LAASSGYVSTVRAYGGAFTPLHHQEGNKMASYIEGALIKDEKVIYTGHVSLWSLAPLIFLGFICLFFFGLGLIIWLVAFIRYKTTEMAFTNKRVIAKFGFISRKTIELNITKVESIQVNQGILGRIFNYGTLIVSGAGNPQAPIPGISDPMAFRRAFMESQDQAGVPQPA
jgi:uncharacterized membrane protein YdbT with pleckstrin-like domain